MSEPSKKWRDLRDDFLSYTRAERNGIILLIALIVLVNAWNVYERHFKFEEFNYAQAIADIEAAYEDAEMEKELSVSLFKFDPNDVSEEELRKLGFVDWKIKTFLKYRSTGAKFKNLDDFAKVYSIDSLDLDRLKDYIHFPNTKSKTRSTTVSFKKQVSEKPTLFEFDPNIASKEDLKSLGLSDRVINTILNFRKKGSFRKPNDMAKIYGLDNSTFERLIPFIKINQRVEKNKIQSKAQRNNSLDTTKIDPVYSKKKEPRLALRSIDVNIATVEEWQRIKGIGPVYASRIVKFRDELGGFYKIEQLGETFGIEDSVYQKIVPFVKVSPPKNKILINSINVDSLAKHPYLTWGESKVILNFREKNGPFLNAEDVYKCRRLTEKEWQRLLPYFDYSTK